MMGRTAEKSEVIFSSLTCLLDLVDSIKALRKFLVSRALLPLSGGRRLDQSIAQEAVKEGNVLLVPSIGHVHNVAKDLFLAGLGFLGLVEERVDVGLVVGHGQGLHDTQRELLLVDHGQPEFVERQRL